MLRIPISLLVLAAGIIPVTLRAQTSPWCAAGTRCGWFVVTDLAIGRAVSRTPPPVYGIGAGDYLLTGGVGLMRTVGPRHAVGLSAIAAVERVVMYSSLAYRTRVEFGLGARYRYALGTRSFLEAQAGLPISGRGGVIEGRISPVLGLMWHPRAAFGIGARLVTENYLGHQCTSYMSRVDCFSAVPLTPVHERRWYVDTQLSGRYGAIGIGAALVALGLGLIGPSPSSIR